MLLVSIEALAVPGTRAWLRQGGKLSPRLGQPTQGLQSQRKAYSSRSLDWAELVANHTLQPA